MNVNKKRISTSFQKWLLLIVGIAFAVTLAFLGGYQTKLFTDSAESLLDVYIKDVRQDIYDTADRNLLTLARAAANEVNSQGEVSDEFLRGMLDRYKLSEINIVNPEGIIIVSTDTRQVGYDLKSAGLQSAEFQVGYDEKAHYESMYVAVLEVVRNRHVGEDGFLIVADSKWNIISDRYNNDAQPITILTAMTRDFASIDKAVMFDEGIYIGGKFQRCFCMYDETEGFRILAVYPYSEAMASRDVSLKVMTAMQILIFGALFILIFYLVRKLVVRNIHKINESLSAITDGNLDTVVDVRSHLEFDSLSNDINATVDTLKRYIKEAEERIDAELAFAKAIQHSALPAVHPLYDNRKEFDIFASMHTAKEVGGDFYDFYFIDEDHLAFLIADVSGKGIPAAMFMMRSKTIIKSYAESGMSVEEVFTLANEKLCEGNDAGMFVTAWMGILNIRNGKVLFANAGHNHPLVKHSDGTFEYLKSRAGFVLAGMEGVRYRKNELVLEPGDAIYLYTDGVTEATDLNEELYGEDRLHSILEKYKDETMEVICGEIKKDVDLFAGEAPQFDDITMLALKYNG